jgi:hypothetical protein
MLIKYLVSAPNGDIPLSTDELSIPFKITPSEIHPFLTLKDYFEAIEKFILRDHGKPLMAVIMDLLNKSFDVEDIQKILIRSEKHGVLYHLASVEIFFGTRSVKLSVSTAVFEKGRDWLTHEFDILKFLDRTFALPYLPKPYFAGAIERHADHSTETLTMVLADWFEDYHEWHLSLDKESGKQRVVIWDLKNGHWFASEEESQEIFKKAAKILTLYYDTRNFSHIYPWHHAAGDFIVKRTNGTLDVKLTTARSYESFMGFFSQEDVDPLIALIYFFLNLIIRMRLDRLDGLGDLVWAGNFSVEASTRGFFEALRIREAEGTYYLGRVEDLFSLLKSFSPEEIEKLLHSLLEIYRKNDPEDFSIIQPNLKNHVNRLYQVIQNFRL